MNKLNEITYEITTHMDQNICMPIVISANPYIDTGKVAQTLMTNALDYATDYNIVKSETYEILPMNQIFRSVLTLEEREYDFDMLRMKLKYISELYEANNNIKPIMMIQNVEYLYDKYAISMLQKLHDIVKPYFDYVQFIFLYNDHDWLSVDKIFEFKIKYDYYHLELK